MRCDSRVLLSYDQDIKSSIFVSVSLCWTCVVHLPASLTRSAVCCSASSQHGCICCRGHTGKASPEHVKAGGNAWDTCKPLHKWFKHLHRVLLMDDDAYKVMLLLTQMCYMSSSLHVHVHRNITISWRSGA